MKLCSASLFCLLIGASADAAAFKFGTQTITVPDGFEVQLVAGPPLVDRPIMGDFDELGRLYVADSAGVNDAPEKQLAEKPHRILRLEDSNGDGIFDKQVVFADKMMFPEGILYHDGAVYCGAPPSIWKLQDTDGDGVADKREEWFKGGVLTGCANDVHGPYAGSDGWIYWTKGAFAKMNVERPGRPPINDRAAHIFRAKPDGSQLEVVMSGGMDNPVEVTFSPEGEPFFTTTFFVNPEAGRRDAIVHLIYGAAYPKVHDVVDEIPRTGDLLPPLTHLGPAVPSGLMMYYSRDFGTDFHLNLFSTQFNLHKVQRHALQPFGASYKSRDIDFLVSDSTDFHPTDVLEDADGSILVIDTGGWYKLCCPTSQLAKPDVLGAIYRVRRSAITPNDDPRGLKIKWRDISPTQLTRLLDDPRHVVRSRAIAELARRGEPAIDALAASLGRRAPVEQRRNALWALTRIESPRAREAVRGALSDSDPSVKKVAAYSTGLHRDKAAREDLGGMLRSPLLHVRRSAATSLGRLEAADGVAPLLTAAPGPADRILEHSVIFALMESSAAEAVRTGLSAPNVFTRRAALIALDQMRPSAIQPEDIMPHLSSSDSLLRETSRWIAGHHPEWGAQLSGIFGERLFSADASDDTDLQRQLAEFARHPAIQELLGSVAAKSDAPGRARLLSLRAMRQTRLREAPQAWNEPLALCLASQDDQLTRESVATIRALSSLKGGFTNLNDRLLGLARNPQIAEEVRVDAISAVSGTPPGLDNDLFDFLMDTLASSHSPAQRTAVANVLARARLSPLQQERLVEVLPRLGPMELARVTGAFESVADEGLGLKLIEALKKSPGLKGLRADTLKARLAKFPAPVQKQSEQLMRVLNVNLTQQQTRLEQLQSALIGGDRRRGQAIFNSTRAACATCHTIGYLGGQLGPDLTRIGSVRTERDLLEAIIYPSASFARAYEPTIIETRQGEEHSGIVKRETAESVLLVTGPNLEQNIPRSDIETIRPGSVSIMPEGLDEQLTRQELADLLAFLKSLK
jgi:putative membrane-bound dehydrogenase-like protein